MIKLRWRLRPNGTPLYELFAGEVKVGWINPNAIYVNAHRKKPFLCGSNLPEIGLLDLDCRSSELSKAKKFLAGKVREWFERVLED